MTGMKFQRNTRQRRVILEELRKLTSHPTASALYEIVRLQMPKISLGTVYRNLDLLVQMNLVQKLRVAGSEARFDGNVSDHYHVRCIECGRVDDLHEVPADLVREGVEELAGYRILGYRVDFYGLCPDCTKSSALNGD